MAEYFSEAYITHMKRPLNVAPVGGPAWEVSGVGTIEGPRLKTLLTVWVGVERVGDAAQIKRVAWRSTGMPEAVPAASAVSAYLLAGGLDAMAAAGMQVDDVVALVGGIPRRRRSSALWVLQALRRALADAGAIGAQSSDAGDDDERACHCMGVTFGELRLAARIDSDRLNLQRRTGFGTGCGTCLLPISDFLDGLQENQ